MQGGYNQEGKLYRGDLVFGNSPGRNGRATGGGGGVVVP